MTTSTDTKVAIVTGGSTGLGRSLTDALAAHQWHVITDARHGAAVARAHNKYRDRVTQIPGDVTDPRHQEMLVAAAREAGRLDLLVHNASTLGPTPLQPLGGASVAAVDEVLQTNVVAPLAISIQALDLLSRCGGSIVSISSDAAVEHYEGWGMYAASKAALDHLTLTLAAENPHLRVYAVDPGDMRTAMHQAAFPGEDISDRPTPESVVPAFLNLLRLRPDSGRYAAKTFS